MVNNIRQILAVGENVVVEFKRCGNGIKFGTYENIFDGKADVPINVPISVPISVPINGSKKPSGYPQALETDVSETAVSLMEVDMRFFDRNDEIAELRRNRELSTDRPCIS
jgi:hypothetical protein